MIDLLICLALRSPPAANRIKECESPIGARQMFDHDRTSANSIGLEVDPIVPASTRGPHAHAKHNVRVLPNANGLGE
jgi:hypothetical protein